MGYAEFTDRAGKSWKVWHTLPRLAALMNSLPPDWKQGWLTFESDDDKRRLAPFPPKWEQLPATRLELLCRMAQPASLSAVNGDLQREERSPA
jgi:hypothetical protein